MMVEIGVNPLRCIRPAGLVGADFEFTVEEDFDRLYPGRVCPIWLI